MKFDDDGGVLKQQDCDLISTRSTTGRPSGFWPLTQGLRMAQQQWPSATQHSIAQTSCSVAATSESDGDKLLNSNTSAAKAARHIAICLNAFAVIAF
jgi:hypothetical protein